MGLKKILIDYTDVVKKEVCTEVSIKGITHRITIGVNPINKKVLFSLFLDKLPCVLNVVAVNEDYLVGVHSDDDFKKGIVADFVFVTEKVVAEIGNPVNYKNLGKTTFLYANTGGE
ncbi:MAG: hypothetical protein ACRC6E_11555 [Fusobacteriaceae bacterium]